MCSLIYADSFHKIVTGISGGCASVIDIPQGVERIGECAFARSNITGVKLPESLQAIDNSAFEGCMSLSSIQFPSNLAIIGAFAFLGCSSISGNLIMPPKVTSIPDFAFCGCKSLTSISLSDSVASIGEGAFSLCTSLAQFTFPPTVSQIGNSIFSCCTSLKSVKLHNAISSIGICSFQGCSSLSGDIMIPQKTTEIGGWAFDGCTGLHSITINGGIQSIGDGAFCSCKNVYPQDLVQKLGSARLNTQYLVIDGAQTVSGLAFGFYGCVEIGEGVNEISSYAFKNRVIISMKLPSTLRAIGDAAFQSAHCLLPIVIPTGVTSIASSAFDGCTVIIGDSVTHPRGWDSGNDRSIAKIVIDPSTAKNCGYRP